MCLCNACQKTRGVLNAPVYEEDGANYQPLREGCEICQRSTCPHHIDHRNPCQMGPTIEDYSIVEADIDRLREQAQGCGGMSWDDIDALAAKILKTIRGMRNP